MATLDRIIIKDGIRSRLYDSIETAAKLSKGKVVVDVVSKDSIVMSENYACPECDFSLPELEPRMFSFNAPYGACSECKGLGIKLSIDEDLIIPNKDLSINEGAIVAINLDDEVGENPLTLDTSKVEWPLMLDPISFYVFCLFRNITGCETTLIKSEI